MAYFTASCDTVETNKKFAESLELDYPILSDPGKSVAEAYGVVNESRPFPQRWTFFIKQDGTIAHIEKKVDTRGHGAQVCEKLDELGLGGK